MPLLKIIQSKMGWEESGSGGRKNWMGEGKVGKEKTCIVKRKMMFQVLE